MRFKNLIFVFLFCACANLEPHQETAEAQFEKAQKQAKKGYYPEALASILKLQHQFPYHAVSVLGDQLRADILFDQREWMGAIQAYQAFINLYPQHKRAEYCAFRQILAWNQHIPKKADRDISDSTKALKAIDQFLKKYSKSPHKKEVQAFKKEISERLVERELLIAQFYFKEGKWNSAENRLKPVIKNHTKSVWYKPALKLALNTAKKQNNDSLEKKYLKKLQALK